MITKAHLKEIKIKTGVSENNSMPYNVKPVGACENERKPVIIFEIESGTGEKRWQPNDFLTVDCMADIRATLTLEAVFFTKHELRFSISNTLVGGRHVKCCFELKYLDSSSTYPRNLPGHLKSFAVGKPVSPDDIDRVEIRVLNAAEFKSFFLYGVSVTNQLPDLRVSGEPLADRFGQQKNVEWKGKTHTEHELTEFLQDQYEWSKTHNSYGRDDYDKYGAGQG